MSNNNFTGLNKMPSQSNVTRSASIASLILLQHVWLELLSFSLSVWCFQTLQILYNIYLFFSVINLIFLSLLLAHEYLSVLLSTISCTSSIPSIYGLPSEIFSATLYQLLITCPKHSNVFLFISSARSISWQLVVCRGTRGLTCGSILCV